MFVRLLLTLLFLGCFAFSSTGCGDDDPIDPNDTTKNSNCSKNAKVGFDFTIAGPGITTTTWAEQFNNAQINSGSFLLNSTSSIGSTLTITVKGVAVGTYKVDNTGANQVNFVYADIATPQQQYNKIEPNAENSLKIDAYDTANKKVSGCFTVHLLTPLSGVQRTLSGTFKDIKIN